MKAYKLLLFSAGLLMTACKDDFLDRQPLDVVSNQTFWRTQQDAVNAVNNTYRYLGDSWYRIFLSAATDDSYSWSNWPADVQYAGNGSATSSTSYFSHFWQQHYNTIAAANNVLDNIDKVPNLAPELKARLMAEVTFMRAYAYQQLIGLYGDVPLITKVQSTAEFNVPRTPKAEVATFIANELTTAADALPLTYGAADKGRITKGAALALKARTLLYQERWAEAATAAKAVMDLGQYSIDPDYLSLFNGTNKNSAEILLSAQYLKSTYPTAAATWLGAPSLGGWGQVVPLQSLVDAYEATDGQPIGQSAVYDPAKPFDNRDPRLKLTIVVPGSMLNSLPIDVTKTSSIDALGKNNASFSGYYYRKGVPADIEGSWDSNSYNDEVLLRYAEVLLTYAEAKNEAGQLDQSVYAAINQVRGRAGVQMPAVTAVTHPSKEALREVIRRERRVEFALEEHRLFDIRRWKIAPQVMSGNVYGILNNYNASRADYGQHVLVEKRQFNPNRDYLWAIPQNEVDLNKNLKQNPGW